MTDKNHKGAHLAIVDDDPLIAEFITQFAELQGFQVTSFSGGASFLKAFSKNPVDAVILDVMMPDVDAFDVITAIKNKKNRPEIFLCTGKEDIFLEAAGEVAKHSGLRVFGSIKKPIDPNELQEQLSKLYDRVSN